MPLDPFLSAVGGKLGGSELTCIVGVEDLKLEAAFTLCGGSDMLDGVHSFCLHHKKAAHMNCNVFSTSSRKKHRPPMSLA